MTINWKAKKSSLYSNNEGEGNGRVDRERGRGRGERERLYKLLENCTKV